jgi:demethylmenaquinone methyltransferase/2-methoxy-6-polyprenyl-1,4-benzoquinol methylase
VSDYGFVAKIYDPAFYLPLRSVRKAVIRELSNFKEKKIIDLCCGTGNQLRLLSDRGFRDLYGVDRSASMLDVAIKDGHPIHVYNEDATDTSFDDELFDIVMMSFAIHENDRITQENLLKEAYRLLKKEGLLIIADFVLDDKTKSFSRMAIRFVERIAGKRHYRNFLNYVKNKGLESLINEEKFNLVKRRRRLLNGVRIAIYKKSEASVLY